MPIRIQIDEQPTLNLTPMIDVVFLLIIFFMVATKFTELERSIELEVPKVSAAGAALAPPRPRTVAVFADGSIELDSQEVTLEKLQRQLSVSRTTDPDVNVIIRGDSQCAFQHIAAALAACREAGVAELGITVRIASRSNSAARR